jgi:hypothetical protein
MSRRLRHDDLASDSRREVHGQSALGLRARRSVIASYLDQRAGVAGPGARRRDDRRKLLTGVASPEDRHHDRCPADDFLRRRRRPASGTEPEALFWNVLPVRLESELLLPQQCVKCGSTSFRGPWPHGTLGWYGYLYLHWRMGSHTPRRFPRLASLRRNVRSRPRRSECSRSAGAVRC